MAKSICKDKIIKSNIWRVLWTFYLIIITAVSYSFRCMNGSNSGCVLLRLSLFAGQTIFTHLKVTSWYPRPSASSPLLPPSKESKGTLLWFSCFPCLLRWLSLLGWGCLIFSLWEGGDIYGQSVGLPIEYDQPKVASMIRAYISQITNLNEHFSLTLNFDLEGDLWGHRYWSHWNRNVD